MGRACALADGRCRHPRRGCIRLLPLDLRTGDAAWPMFRPESGEFAFSTLASPHPTIYTRVTPTLAPKSARRKLPPIRANLAPNGH